MVSNGSAAGRQREMAGAKIVQRKTGAEFVDPRQHLSRVFRVLHHERFRQFPVLGCHGRPRKFISPSRRALVRCRYRRRLLGRRPARCRNAGGGAGTAAAQLCVTPNSGSEIVSALLRRAPGSARSCGRLGAIPARRPRSSRLDCDRGGRAVQGITESQTVLRIGSVWRAGRHRPAGPSQCSSASTHYTFLSQPKVSHCAEGR
jgi:hypothetical protein